MSINLHNIAISNISGVDYYCISTRISKGLAGNLLQDTDLNEEKWNPTKHKHLLWHIKMGKEVTTFGDTEVEKCKFHCYNNPIFINDININSIWVSNNIQKQSPGSIL